MNTYSYALGPFWVTITENGTQITGVTFGKSTASAKLYETKLLKEAGKQLLEYTLNKRRVFELPLCARGTQFQKKVWDALLGIPYGETKSYGEIANTIGNEKAARAVGMANNKNPIPIFIPCHRVIGASGKLIGYSGGLNIKEYLLTIERSKQLV